MAFNNCISTFEFTHVDGDCRSDLRVYHFNNK